MSKQSERDQTFHMIIEKMIATGRAPQYGEIATYHILPVRILRSVVSRTTSLTSGIILLR